MNKPRSKPKPKNSRPNKTRSKKNKTPPRKRNWRTAKAEDRYELYENSVQDPESEVDLMDQVWRENRNRLAKNIREDFAGTFCVCCEWIKRRKSNTAIAVDLDPECLDWGRSRLGKRLDGEQLQRLTVLQDDVRTVKTKPVDSVLAMNFSYYLFRKRTEMIEYYKHVHESLVDDGLFLLDAYGGSEAFEELEEERDCDGFTYVWEQHRYNPIDGEAMNYIHFRFPDGSEMKRAFEYGWRLWTLPEIQEMLAEAGFRKVHVYWEGEDEDGEGNGEFAKTRQGDAAAGWIAYLVAEK